MNRERALEILREETAKFDALGFDRMDINMNKVDVINNNHVFGHMTSTGVLGLNRHFMENADEDEVRATIAHEVCHRVWFSVGHDDAWKEAVTAMLKSYRPTYVNGEYHLNAHPYSKKRAYLPHFSLGAEATPTKCNYAIKCESCGIVIKRTKFSKVIQHPESYRCCCGGNLKRIK